MKLQYVEKQGGMVSAKDLNTVVREINRIVRRDGEATPAAVVEEARSESSPIHGYFNWDDTKAAELYRRWQARMLIASVRVIYKGPSEISTTRAFVNVITTSDGKAQQGYIGIARAMSSKEIRAQLIETALQEVSDWKNRYQHLTELAAIFDAIDKTTQ